MVIPSRNPANLKACAGAIRQMDPGLPIILASDGIAPGEVSDEHADYIVQCPSPFCFARNVNLGIMAAGDDDIIACNDDALLRTPDGFRTLQRIAREHPEYGAISAVTNVVGNLNQMPLRRGLREDDKTLCYVCVLLPRTTLDRVGLLDERFFQYGWDDNDHSRRILQAGLKLGIYDFCLVDHSTLKSTFRGDPNNQPDLEVNGRIYREKWAALK